ncbi:hypothetical protein NC653_033352 [Populus alba x Populus x berolinensis]|uniref:Uncharacterized protein n=1 Tax=Populus alba x Populus x berolinensis TaxID=444605 RepID=A0AAD6LWE6_9ROSI|nr:hypothetical protein NC653_033352 [Populus alba x Populus x berolinensis]
MARRNGNVTSARRNMQYNLIGKLIKRHVVRGNTSVIVEPSFPVDIFMQPKPLQTLFDILRPQELPQELVPIPFKSMNMAGGMFSSSSGTLFGSQRSISSTSSLQLSSKDSSGLHYLQDNKNGCPISASAHMSATAMLKKAAQMGATASNSINSPVMQKSFASSMAGPHDQLSSIKPPTYGRIQQHSTSYATSHHMCRVKLAWLESMALEDLVTSPCKEGHKKPHRYLTLVVQITQQ